MHIRAPKKYENNVTLINVSRLVSCWPGALPPCPSCHWDYRFASNQLEYLVLRTIYLYYSKIGRYVFLKPHPLNLIPTSKSSTWLAGYVARSSVTWTDTSKHRLVSSCLAYHAHYAQSEWVYLHVEFIYLFSDIFALCVGMPSFI